MDQNIIKKVHTLKEKVNEVLEQYKHSTSLATGKSQIILADQNKHSFEFNYGIKDMLLVGALTNSQVLMTGGTDTGKTTLAKLMMNALFGTQEEGWHRIDIDLDFGKDACAEIDYSAITEGKTSSEMYDVQKYLLLPGLILDEINRTHAGLATKIMRILDMDITLPNGQTVKTGAPLNDFERYQYQIIAINEGEDYSGTFGMDKALRRRALIEIPIDAFPPTAADKLEIQRAGSKSVDLFNTENHFEDIKEIYKSLPDIPVHPSAEMFISYLGAFNYCRKLERGKSSVNPDKLRGICSANPDADDARELNRACSLLTNLDDELCPNVQALSSGISKNLRFVAKGVALLRATKFAEMVYGYLVNHQEATNSYQINNPDEFKDSLRTYVENEKLDDIELAKAAVTKYVSDLEVELADVKAIVGLVAYSKVPVNKSWIAKKYKGDRLAAIERFVNTAEQKFLNGVRTIGSKTLTKIIEGKATEGTLEKTRDWCLKNNPWMLSVIDSYTQTKSKSQKGYLDLYES